MNGKLGLYDIQGLDHISFWPLALGWWILIGLVAAVGLTVAGRALYLAHQRRSWRARAREILRTLERELTISNTKATAAELASLLRTLAIRKFSRREAAALNGREWLRWLEQMDPKHYDWSSAQFLLEAPYCSDQKVFQPDEIKAALRAAKGWVK